MIADQLSEFIFQCRYDTLPKEVVEKAKMCLIDWIACGIAGSNHEIGNKLVSIAVHNGGPEEATIIGHKGKVSALWAAFANGALSHAAEMDDGHKWSISHPGVTVIPAALAVGELLHCSGKDIITAIVAGYEVSMRVGQAVGPEHYKLWHTTSTCGTFGASAAASKLMKLSMAQTADALGNAGSQAAGVWQFIEEGAMTKLLHTAKVGFNGLLASQLAQSGFTGAHSIFEGDRGFLKAYAVNPLVEELTSGLGESFKIMESNFKVHASCGHTHSPVDAVLSARAEQHFNCDEITAIKIQTYSTALRLTGNKNPLNVFEAKFSMPYCIAVALVYGKVDERQFEQDVLFNERVRALISRVHIEVSPELEIHFPESRPVVIELETAAGSFRIENYFRKGDPENPLTQLELEEKFMRLTINIVGERQAKSIIESVRQIENIPDIEVLTRKLMLK